MSVNVILKFLGDLAENNDRDWFNAHRDSYEEALRDMRVLVSAIIDGVRRFDDSIGDLQAGDAMFRIYRDTRFSHDKTPYKTHMGAFIAKSGRKSHGPGYYFHLDPKERFFGGGVWMPDPAFLKSIRSEIYYDYPGLLTILKGRSFLKYYSGVLDLEDKLKKAPKDFPADFEGIEMLKHKSYFCEHRIPDDILRSADLVEYAVDGFKACSAFNAFLARAR